ncbi:MAG: complex I subunit 5 family protein [Thermodesulfobacteriota bacterium]
MTAGNLLDIFHALVLSLVTGVPLLGALGCCLSSARRARWSLLPWTTVPALLVSLTIPGDLVVQVPWFFMGGCMGLDQTGRIFLCLSAVIWMLTSFTVAEKFQNRKGELRFSGYFLVAMAGNFGLILAKDMFSFYLFFALMSFASYGLIVHERTSEARRAGNIYLILVMVSEVAMFIALVLIFFKTQSSSLADINENSISMSILIFLFMAFGVKVGALPFQAWMAPAYQQSPIPGATALAGAMVNAGLLGWLRFIPLGVITSDPGAFLFITAGALAALYGVVCGLGQRKPGAVLAFSSMSQMGLMTIIIGLGLYSVKAGEYAVYLLPLYAVHHSLAKGSLFLVYDVVNKGGRLASPLLLIALLLPSLSLAGLPFTGGAIVKTGFKELALVSGTQWYGVSKIFLPVSSIGTTILMLYCSRLLWHKRANKDNSQRVLLWPCFTALAGAAFWLWLWPAAHGLSSHSLDASLLFHSFWPVAVGSGLFLIWLIMAERLKGEKGYLFPETDFGNKAEIAWSALAKKCRTGAEKLYPVPGTSWARKWLSLSATSPLGKKLRKPEKIMGRWSMVGFFYLAVCIILVFCLGS